MEHTDWHPADVKAALEKAGWSCRRLSRHHGYHPVTIQKALRGPYPEAERLIAEALRLRPREIWPSRYDAQGNPKYGRAGGCRAGDYDLAAAVTPRGSGMRSAA